MLLPMSWQNALATVNGVYLLVCPTVTSNIVDVGEVEYFGLRLEGQAAGRSFQFENGPQDDLHESR